MGSETLNYEQTADLPTNRPTNNQKGSQGSFTSNNLDLILLLFWGLGVAGGWGAKQLIYSRGARDTRIIIHHFFSSLLLKLPYDPVRWLVGLLDGRLVSWFVCHDFLRGRSYRSTYFGHIDISVVVCFFKTNQTYVEVLSTNDSLTFLKKIYI